MSQTYRFHFSFDDCTQTELADMLSKISVSIQKKYFDINIYDSINFKYKEQLLGENRLNWHIASLTTDNMELLAFVYQKILTLPTPIIFGFKYEDLQKFCYGDFSNLELEIMVENLSHLISKENIKEYIYKNIVKQPELDKSKVETSLISSGFYKDTKFILSTRDYFLLAKRIKESILDKDYLKIGQLFCVITNNVITDNNFKENLYIKRINSSRYIAKDFAPLITRINYSDLIQNNFIEFLNCVDELLLANDGKIEKEIHNIIDEYVPSIESLSIPNEQRTYSFLNGQVDAHCNQKSNWSRSFYFNPKTHLTCYCKKGIIFDYYPDPIHAARIADAPKINKNFLKLWTTLSPDLNKKQIGKGLIPDYIDTYWHRNWRMSKREPDFSQLMTSSQLFVKSLVCENISFTGRSHNIEGTNYFEIDLIRYKEPKIIGNEIRNYVNELFWNAENKLRVNHNLPKIGEGWLSEMRMFELLFNNFPDSLHHYSPKWLKPQHYDVFIPSLNIAFEYQGKQHFEPIDFFGAEKGFENNQRRDSEKLNKSKKNKVKLIYWNYDEPLNFETLEKKFQTIKK
jgi:hypothetical protein